MDKTSHLTAFTHASSEVSKRLYWVALGSWLVKSALFAGLVGVLLILGLRVFLGWNDGEVWFACVLVGIWIIVGTVYALRQKPGNGEALVILDREGGWKDQFGSAWEFLEMERCSPAERLHITRAYDSLDAALNEFPEEVKLPRLRSPIWVGLLVIGFALTPLGRRVPEVSEIALSDAMVGVAAEEAGRLKDQMQNLSDLDALSVTEGGEVDQLLAEVKGTLEEMSSAGEWSTGDLLDALEARARSIERLAEQLADEEVWASDGMLKEMESNSDTAALGKAARDKDAARTASEAAGISEMLGEQELASTVAERYEEVLRRIMAASVEEDLSRPIGERIGMAKDAMSGGKRETAAQEFRLLAEHFETLAARDASIDKLEQFAESIRDAGSEVGAAGKQFPPGEQDRREIPEGLTRVDEDSLAQALENMVAPQLAEVNPEEGEKGMAVGGGSELPPSQPPVPGERVPSPGEGDSGSPGAQALKAPVPGESPKEGSGGAIAGEPGDGSSNESGKPLSAPIPGTTQNSEGSGDGVAGSGSGGDAPPGQGGNEAGSGTAELVDTASELFETSVDSRVEAQINEEGDSTVRVIEGGKSEETAQRSRQEIIVDFIAVEEQSLDEKSLPLSRREHVVRYFSAIREQFEKEAE